MMLRSTHDGSMAEWTAYVGLRYNSLPYMLIHTPEFSYNMNHVTGRLSHYTTSQTAYTFQTIQPLKALKSKRMNLLEK